MKRFALTIMMAGALPIFAAELVRYDFSGGAIKTTGSLPPLKMSGQAFRGGALFFDGETTRGVIEKSKDVHIMDGGTVIVKVKFDDKGDGKNNHMLILKDKEWWLGRSGKNLYFNFTEGEQSGRGVLAPVSFDRVLTIGLSVSSDDKYVIYADGEKAASGILSVRDTPTRNERSIMVGDGWGAPWKFKGEIHKLAIYNEALAEEKLAKLTENN